MKFRELSKCTIEARDAEVRQQMVYDSEAGRYTDQPQRDEDGRYLFTTQVDFLSDIEPSMTTEYLTIHALEAPTLQLTKMHQALDAENLRIEVWRSKTRSGYGLHCDWLQVAGAKAEKA